MLLKETDGKGLRFEGFFDSENASWLDSFYPQFMGNFQVWVPKSWSIKLYDVAIFHGLNDVQWQIRKSCKWCHIFHTYNKPARIHKVLQSKNDVQVTSQLNLEVFEGWRLDNIHHCQVIFVESTTKGFQVILCDTDISHFLAFFVDFTFATKDNNTEWAAICFSNFFWFAFERLLMGGHGMSFVVGTESFNGLVLSRRFQRHFCRSFRGMVS